MFSIHSYTVKELLLSLDQDKTQSLICSYVPCRPYTIQDIHRFIPSFADRDSITTQHIQYTKYPVDHHHWKFNPLWGHTRLFHEQTEQKEASMYQRQTHRYCDYIPIGCSFYVTLQRELPGPPLTPKSTTCMKYNKLQWSVCKDNMWHYHFIELRSKHPPPQVLITIEVRSSDLKHVSIHLLARNLALQCILFHKTFSKWATTNHQTRPHPHPPDHIEDG
jgi:hypothetical protein